jgi:hypothetical protein
LYQMQIDPKSSLKIARYSLEAAAPRAQARV